MIILFFIYVVNVLMVTKERIQRFFLLTKAKKKLVWLSLVLWEGTINLNALGSVFVLEIMYTFSIFEF
jgi:hypothetical protein